MDPRVCRALSHGERRCVWSRRPGSLHGLFGGPCRRSYGVSSLGWHAVQFVATIDTFNIPMVNTFAQLRFTRYHVVSPRLSHKFRATSCRTDLLLNQHSQDCVARSCMRSTGLLTCSPLLTLLYHQPSRRKRVHVHVHVALRTRHAVSDSDHPGFYLSRLTRQQHPAPFIKRVTRPTPHITTVTALCTRITSSYTVHLLPARQREHGRCLQSRDR